MQQNQDIQWDELKNQYYHHLMTLDASIEAAHSCALEMSRIYSQVLTKAKDTSPDTMKKFSDLWLDKIDIVNDEARVIKDDYDKLQQGTRPLMSDLKDFEYALQRKYHEKAISLLTEYKKSMQMFYYAWKQMWP